nr:uncharacterized protein LOC122272820 [Parasteatoda tepidariorum]
MVKNYLLEISTEMLSQNIIEDTFGPCILETSLSSGVVLAPLNEQVNALNDLILQKFPGETIICTSHDTATACDRDESENESIMLHFQPEYLAKINITSLPLHKLKLKIGAVVMLVRNLFVAAGLCNGTRLIVQKMMKNVLFYTVMMGDKKGNSVVIPRITLNTRD